HLGSVYARDVMGRPSPGVGLLNVGEEDEKGNAVVKEAHQLLKQTPGIRYVGNVEGRDILAGRGKGGEIDVVVCDGFVGNAILKFLDYSEYGGAPLLGVKVVAIICHGASLARAIMNAVRVAAQMVTSHLDQDIGAEFAEGGAVR